MSFRAKKIIRAANDLHSKQRLLLHAPGLMPTAVLEKLADLQAVGEKGNQNVSVGAMLELMVDGALCRVHS